MAPLLVFSRGIFRFLSGPWKTKIGTSRVFVIRVESVDSIFSSWVDIAQNRRKDSSLKFYWKQKFLLRNIAAHCVQFSQVSGGSELDNTVDRILPMYLTNLLFWSIGFEVTVYTSFVIWWPNSSFLAVAAPSTVGEIVWVREVLKLERFGALFLAARLAAETARVASISIARYVS